MIQKRNTRQKEIIFNKIQDIKTFFSVEEIYKMIRKKDTKVGIATVYRYLKYLLRQGKIHSYTCDGRVIYSKEGKNHCHFICQNCEGIEHFNIKSLDFVQRKINGSICHFQINVDGVCKNCIAKIS